MKHDGAFNLIPDAKIGDADLTTDSGEAGNIVKDVSVVVSVSPEGEVSLRCGSYAGRRALASEITDENKVYDVYTSHPYQKNPLIQTDRDGNHYKSPEKDTTYYLSKFSSPSHVTPGGYYRWDGEKWYYAEKEGDNWRLYDYK